MSDVVDSTSVLVITSAHTPTDIRVFRKQATSLVASGYSVSLIAPFREGAGHELEAAGVEYVPLAGGTSRGDRVRRLFEIGRHLVRFRHRYDVWHFHDPELILICTLLRATVARRVRVIYDVHENYSAVLLSRDWIPARLRRPVSFATRLIERATASRVSLIVAATPSIAGLFRKTSHRAVATVRNFPLAPPADGSPAEPIEPKPPDKIRCVYVGGLTAVRGVREMVSAIALLDSERFELVLAGPFGSVDFEREICDGAPPNVKWLGVLPYGKIGGLLESSDIGLVCLLPEPNHIESLPTKLFEYLAAGLPVVASNFESWRQFVEDVGVGIQVDPASPAAIADAIAQLAGNVEQRLEMGKRGQDLALEAFVWEREASTLCDAYQQMLRSEQRCLAPAEMQPPSGRETRPWRSSTPRPLRHARSGARTGNTPHLRTGSGDP